MEPSTLQNATPPKVSRDDPFREFAGDPFGIEPGPRRLALVPDHD